MKLTVLICTGLILTSACLPRPRPTQERILSASTPTTAVSEEVLPCAPENWVIAITSLEQTDLGDGTQLVIANIGIENNDTLWGQVNGPQNKTRKSVFLKTKDGSVYEVLDETQTAQIAKSSESTRTLLKNSGQVATPLMPPGFVTLGKTIDEKPSYYNFAFLIPDSKTPDTLTIGGMEVDCIQPHVVGENGQPIYGEMRIELPDKIYALETDITGVQEAPFARRYPNLVGAELVTPDWKETVFITDVTRNENTIAVTFDFINFSSHADSPSFEGYLMGDDQFFIFPKDFENEQTRKPVKPGQTAQDLTWTFTVPEDETNLVFVYVFGGKVDLNEVYRVNFEE
jgi:hypothetical protein